MKTHAFGVDLGGTTTKIGLFTVDGTLVKKVEFPTDTKDQGEAILPNIARAVDEMMVGRGIAPFEVVGIGMGVPGAVLNDNYVLRCANLNNWGGPVSDELGALTGFTVKLANDANAAALGEYFNGGGKGYNSIVFTTIGTGIGSGIIIDGKLIPGCNGAAGEIGHIKVAEPNEDICGCGKSGCLERYASANGIVRQAIKALSSTSTPSVLREFEVEQTAQVHMLILTGYSRRILLEHIVIACSCRFLQKVNCFGVIEVVLLAAPQLVTACAVNLKHNIESERVKRRRVQSFTAA